MDNATVPTPPEPRQSHTVETVIAIIGVASMVAAVIVDPIALLVTAAAVAAHAIWGWTR